MSKIVNLECTMAGQAPVFPNQSFVRFDYMFHDDAPMMAIVDNGHISTDFIPDLEEGFRSMSFVKAKVLARDALVTRVLLPGNDGLVADVPNKYVHN